jgi:hypothetical protein
MMGLQIVKQPHKFYNYAKPYYEVSQGSAKLGSFWFANGTIYALAANDETHLGTDIGLMETTDAANWVRNKYFELRQNG